MRPLAPRKGVYGWIVKCRDRLRDDADLEIAARDLTSRLQEEGLQSIDCQLLEDTGKSVGAWTDVFRSATCIKRDAEVQFLFGFDGEVAAGPLRVVIEVSDNDHVLGVHHAASWSPSQEVPEITWQRNRFLSDGGQDVVGRLNASSTIKSLTKQVIRKSYVSPDESTVSIPDAGLRLLPGDDGSVCLNVRTTVKHRAIPGIPIFMPVLWHLGCKFQLDLVSDLVSQVRSVVGERTDSRD